MHDVKTRLIPIGGGYDEDWSDKGLKIKYYERKEVAAHFDGAVWSFDGSFDEKTLSYLRSAAVFSDAFESCGDANMLPQIIEHTDGLLPQELLRILLDDAGLKTAEALDILIRCFGGAPEVSDDIDWLFHCQPRTASLSYVLRDILKTASYAFHDAYSACYRSPVGSVENGTELSFSVLASNSVSSAVLELYGDDFYLEVPMSRHESRFECSFTPEKPIALFYRFRLDIAGETKWLCPGSDGHRSLICSERGDAFRLTVYLHGFETPDWFKRGVMYQIYPDRFGFTDDDTARRGVEYHHALGQTPEFHESLSEPVRWQARDFEPAYSPDDFYGGTLRGITEKLPYLSELGVTSLYLNPIFEASSNHRYNTSDYGKIDPILGTNEDFDELCREAERLGIRPVLDGVFSHTGDDSVYFNRYGHYDSVGACQGPASPYYKWYEFRHFPDDYRCWWNFSTLPEVWELDPDWQDFVIHSDNSIVKRWLRHGAEGWRIDVADELPDEALEEIRKAAKAEKPDCLIVGEVWEDPVLKEGFGHRRRYALGTALDSVMNYPLRKAILDFAHGRLSAYGLRDFLLMQQNCYPRPMYYALMNLLGSHDVERLHTTLAVDCDLRSMSRESQLEAISHADYKDSTALQKLCSVIQYVLPGVPCLYYGDEECLDGGCDPFNRMPFVPSGSGLHNFYARLGELRREHSALTDADVSFSVPCAGVIVIERRDENERIRAVINNSGSDYFVPFAGVSLLGEVSDSVLPDKCAEIFKLT